MTALFWLGGLGPESFHVGLTNAIAAPAETDVRRDAVVNAIEEVMPSIVNVSTETIVEIRDPLDQVIRDFFGRYWGRRSAQRQKSLGSGVIIDETGYVLTNMHVVRRADRITVTLADGRSFVAKWIVGTSKTDVALLQLLDTNGEKFKAIRFAPDDDLLLGETVLALGNPFGLGGSVSRGILSSKARRPSMEEESLDINDWLQTDAAINPGNSGGPLVNLRGELIGINVAVFREGQGIGFAIPVKRVSEALSEIFTPEFMRSLWFGANFQTSSGGLVANNVEPGSPAEKGGLRRGDRVLTVNDKTPRNVVDINRELISAEDRRDVRLVVQRGSDRKTLVARLVPEATVFNANLIRQKMGATLQPLTPELAAALGFGQYQGFVIAVVESGGPAERGGLKEGDLVQAFDGQVPGNLVRAAHFLYAKKRGESVQLNVIVPRRARGFVQLFSATKAVVVR